MQTTKYIGFVGDSITRTEYLGKRAQNFARIVSNAFGANPFYVAKGGAGLSSFLPVKVGDGSPDFEGQWRQQGKVVAFARDGVWCEVENPVLRIGDLSPAFESLLGSDCRTVLITHTGTNDFGANHEQGSDNGSHDARHVHDQLREMVRRLVSAKKEVIVFTDLSSSTESFHGLGPTFMADRLAEYRAAATQVSAEFSIRMIDLRPIWESASSQDWLMRRAICKPNGWSKFRFRLHQAWFGDLRGTDAARFTPEWEDRLHDNDPERRPYWFNQHPNLFGQRLIADGIVQALL